MYKEIALCVYQNVLLYNIIASLISMLIELVSDTVIVCMYGMYIIDSQYIQSTLMVLKHTTINMPKTLLEQIGTRITPSSVGWLYIFTW